MSPNESTDQVEVFTLELLRTASMLFGVAADLTETMPADAYPGEEPGNVVVEMMVGTIRTALADVDERDLEFATSLIVQASNRVLEHLQLALGLSRRLNGSRSADGSGRTYG